MRLRGIPFPAAAQALRLLRASTLAGRSKHSVWSEQAFSAPATGFSALPGRCFRPEILEKRVGEALFCLFWKRWLSAKRPFPCPFVAGRAKMLTRRTGRRPPSSPWADAPCGGVRAAETSSCRHGAKDGRARTDAQPSSACVRPRPSVAGGCRYSPCCRCLQTEASGALSSLVYSSGAVNTFTASFRSGSSFSCSMMEPRW